MRLKTCIMILAGTVLGSGLLRAQDVPAVNPMVSEPTTVATPIAAPAAVLIPEQKPVDDGMVSLDFQDADIKNVLKVLSYKSGVNIVAGPEVTGVVTIQLTNVPWQKAFEVILATYNYGFERKGNIITVTTIENLKKRHEDVQMLQEQEVLVTRTFPLSFSKASDILDSINKMKTSRGSVNFDQRTNMLIIRDIESNLELVAEVIHKLDTVTPQVLIEAKVIETKLANDEKLGVDWTVSGTATGASRRNIFPFTDVTNKFIPANEYTTPALTTFTYGTLSAQGFKAVLDLLSSRTDTHIVSNPKIVTLDNQTAKINVGTQFPIPQYTYNTEQAKLQVSGFEFKDIGVILEVTPHVNNANLVTLDFHPKITDKIGTLRFENTDLPEITVEEATTKVMIQNGQTLIIAGLIKDKTTVTKSKIPLLGDIPFLGALFRHTHTDKSKTELLIFLTPHIVTAHDDSTGNLVAGAPSNGKK